MVSYETAGWAIPVIFTATWAFATAMIIAFGGNHND